MWINPFLITRSKFEVENNLLTNLMWGDENLQFKNFTRLTNEEFEEIHSMCEPFIKRSDTPMRNAISTRVRLAVSLHYIATGDSYKSLQFLSRISTSTISVFVPEVLDAVYRQLQPEYMKVYSTKEEWMEVANNFEKMWNFPHVCGALDGKHFKIKAPPNQGSNFYNYKGFHSVILLALVDAHCRFIYIDVGANGRGSDSTIYAESYLHENLINGRLNMPADSLIPGEMRPIPYFFISDDAFPLDKTMMKPYSRCESLTTKQKIFNYRLSRARITVECAFGRLASRFRIFYRPMDVKLDTVDIIIKTACVLHNYLTTKHKQISSVSSVADLEIQTLPATFGEISGQVLWQRYHRSNQIRDTIADYCTNDGDVSFQWRKIGI